MEVNREEDVKQEDAIKWAEEYLNKNKEFYDLLYKMTDTVLSFGINEKDIEKLKELCPEGVEVLWDGNPLSIKLHYKDHNNNNNPLNIKYLSRSITPPDYKEIYKEWANKENLK